MKYVYPVIFSVDGTATAAHVPDLPSIFTFGENIADAISNAQDAIEMWLWDAENKNEAIPSASSLEDVRKGCNEGEFANLVVADTSEYRKANDVRAIKKTLTVPSWLNYEAEKANAPFSQLLQQSLKEYLNLQDR